MFAHKKPRKKHWWGLGGRLRQRKQAQIPWGEREVGMAEYPGEMVREGWRKIRGRRKSSRVTLAMRNTFSAKVCGVHCQKGSTIKEKGRGLYPCV